jgi:pyrroloquinoline quinone biosynthesis protein E
MAERLDANRLELANTQYLGWALVNRKALLPSREQLDRARSVALEARQRLKGQMEVLFVVPDYYRDFPPACMDGWGRRFLLVSPDGLALPCHMAHSLPGLEFERVGTRPLAEIWRSPRGLGQFRGTSWLPEPCQSCERRDVDFGGCRCQAYHLTGRLTATDPVCVKSPDHHLIESARHEQGAGEELVYRGPGAMVPQPV